MLKVRDFNQHLIYFVRVCCIPCLVRVFTLQ